MSGNSFNSQSTCYQSMTDNETKNNNNIDDSIAFHQVIPCTMIETRTPKVDVLHGCIRGYQTRMMNQSRIPQVPLQVYLKDCYPRLCPLNRTMEYRIVQSARISLQDGLKSNEQDDKLVRYLIRNKHTSPLESIKFTFLIHCPLFVARQIMRHRTFSFNEVSGRYSVLENTFYLPSWRKQHSTSKQESTNEAVQCPDLDTKIQEITQECFQLYKQLLALNVSREQARSILPCSLMTSFYMTCDLNNLIKFFQLRLEKHAQLETRLIARIMFHLICPLVPIVCQEIESTLYLNDPLIRMEL